MKNIKENLRTVVFGVEDSFVSTTGVIVGLIAAGTNKETVLAAGLITIVVEATSMGAGEFISNDDNPEKEEAALKKGIAMLVSYFLAGLWVMLPLLIFGSLNNTLIISFTFLSLFFLGLWRGYILGGDKIKYALKTLLIGGAACGFGVAVGLLFR
ncbi:MAG: VIT1/CCC1 transporter family protein [Candidatus Nomurabacteria bacterium]|nr:MAG: VIT1/CCC1 transporter family protein [Candidatus Nomurabacteria bacterium]HRV75857.1 VIT1/CCC1 transporter family protein [Candidatus Saccharimonadales bacterium]